MQLKIIVLGILCLANVPSLFACDVCGSGMGGQYFGILPQFQRHFIGLRFQQSTLVSKHPALFQYDEQSVSTDTYNRYEIWGRWALSNRIQVFGFLPYQFISQAGSRISKTNGLSDPWFIVNWFIINTGDSVEHKFKHALIIGAGAKLPLGEQLKGTTENPIPAQFQPGSGSLDFPFHLGYTIRHRKSGLNVESNFRLTTENAAFYRFGNRFNASARMFFWQKWNTMSIVPSTGLAFELAGKDMHKSEAVATTGGYLLAIHIGFDLYYKSFMLQSQWQPIINSKLGDGNISPKNRVQIGLSYLI